ncbi:MAG: hypothetical protein AABW48_06090 [Nanoarchaeota archaeon]
MTNKTLTNLVLAGALAVGGAGCDNYPEYHFNGKIGDEQVEFTDSAFWHYNYLTVVKADGSKLEYLDNVNLDLKVDEVRITVGNNLTRYCAGSKNPAVKPVMELAQKQFDAYLAKIIEVQTAPLRK